MLRDRFGAEVQEGNYVSVQLTDVHQVVRIAKIEGGGPGIVEHQGQRAISPDTVWVMMPIQFAAEPPGQPHHGLIRLIDHETEAIVKKSTMA